MAKDKKQIIRIISSVLVIAAVSIVSNELYAKIKQKMAAKKGVEVE